MIDETNILPGELIRIEEVKKAVEFYRSAKAGRITAELTRLKKYRSNARKALRDIQAKYTLEKLLREKVLQGEAKTLEKAYGVYRAMKDWPIISAEGEISEVEAKNYIRVPALLFAALKAFFAAGPYDSRVEDSPRVTA